MQERSTFLNEINKLVTSDTSDYEVQSLRWLKRGLISGPYRPSNRIAPRIIKEEIKPFGYTCYVEIDLQMSKKDRQWSLCVNRDNDKKCIKYQSGEVRFIPSLTAIFAPPTLNIREPIDLILFFHGWKIEYPGIETSIEDYLNFSKEKFFQLREAITESARNYILVAPTLGPQSGSGNLTNPGTFDEFMEQIRSAIETYINKRKNHYAGLLNVNRLILAAHSAGGSVMRKIANLHDNWAQRINELWGFDSWYGYAKEWFSYSKNHPNVYIHAYCWDHTNINTAKLLAEMKKLNKGKDNICIEKISYKYTSTFHFELLSIYFKKRLIGDRCNRATSISYVAGREKEILEQSEPISFENTPTVEDWLNNIFTPIRPEILKPLNLHFPPRTKQQIPLVELPDIYDGFDLQFGDSDEKRKFGGVSEPGVAKKHVEQLQRDLRDLGIKIAGKPDGSFGFGTECAVREFQIYAKMPNVAIRVHGPISKDGDDLDSLQAMPNTSRYLGEVNGLVNRETRNLIQLWKKNRWLCPVLVQVRKKVKTATGAMEPGGIYGSHNNLWGYREMTDKEPWVCVRDYSGYYKIPGAKIINNNMTLLGRFSRYSFPVLGGPSTEHKQFNWDEAEVTTENLIGVPYNAINSQSTKSTFKVIRAVSQVECQGYLDHINAYDDAFVSLGTFHWVLGLYNPNTKKVTSGGELPAFLAYVKEKNQRVFDQAIGFFGAGVDKNWNGTGNDFFYKNPIRNYGKGAMTLKRKNSIIKIEQGGEVEIGNYFRNWHWIYRFAMAVRTIPEIKKYVWDFSRFRIRDVLNLQIENFDFVDAQKRKITPLLKDIFTSEMSVALLLRIHVRKPAYIAGVNNTSKTTPLKTIISNAIATMKEKRIEASDISVWSDIQESIMINAIKKYAFDADLENTLKIVEAFKLNGIGLLESRGSFDFDGTNLGNPPVY